METLKDLGNKHGTDKASGRRNKHYASHVYPLYFESIRNEGIKLLELGIGHSSRSSARYGIGRGVVIGPSLRMWQDYFPEGRIYGLDNDPEKRISDSRIRTFIGDQNNVKVLSKVAKCGPFDIIIDDCAHRSDLILASLDFLWEHLKPGGYYVIEDLYITSARDQKHGQTRDVKECLFNAVNSITWGKRCNSVLGTSNLWFVHFYPHIVVLRKNWDRG